MKAAVLEAFAKPLVVQQMPDPELSPHGAIIRVQANGVCRSDWHAWMGDWDWMKLTLPHILGHEFSGTVEAVGAEVRTFQPGDRVVVPFTQGDGTCVYCRSGHQNVCDHVALPGFTYWGGFGEYVHVPNADSNLVTLPEGVSFAEAAALGCRFMTAFHGLVDQAKVTAGEWVVVHGCGGVGMSAVQIASAIGANVVAVDISEDKLAFAKQLGATATVNATDPKLRAHIKDLTGGGAHVSVDALGIAATCQAALRSLRKRGRHLQIGMTSGAERGMIAVPIDFIVQQELQIVGSFGMQPARYAPMLQLVEQKRLRPGELVTETIGIEQVNDVLAGMATFNGVGVTVVTKW